MRLGLRFASESQHDWETGVGVVILSGACLKMSVEDEMCFMTNDFTNDFTKNKKNIFL